MACISTRSLQEARKRRGAAGRGGNLPGPASRSPHRGDRRGLGQPHPNSGVGAPASTPSGAPSTAYPNPSMRLNSAYGSNSVPAKTPVTRLNPSATCAHRTRRRRQPRPPAPSRPRDWLCARARTCDRQGRQWRRGRAGPGAAARQGAVARLRAAAGWNRSGRKWGRHPGFRSDVPRAQPGGTGENNKMAAAPGGGVGRAPLVSRVPLKGVGVRGTGRPCGGGRGGAFCPLVRLRLACLFCAAGRAVASGCQARASPKVTAAHSHAAAALLPSHCPGCFFVGFLGFWLWGLLDCFRFVPAFAVPCELGQQKRLSRGVFFLRARLGAADRAGRVQVGSKCSPSSLSSSFDYVSCVCSELELPLSWGGGALRVGALRAPGFRVASPPGPSVGGMSVPIV